MRRRHAGRPDRSGSRRSAARQYESGLAIKGRTPARCADASLGRCFTVAVAGCQRERHWCSPLPVPRARRRPRRHRTPPRRRAARPSTRRRAAASRNRLQPRRLLWLREQARRKLSGSRSRSSRCRRFPVGQSPRRSGSSRSAARTTWRARALISCDVALNLFAYTCPGGDTYAAFAATAQQSFIFFSHFIPLSVATGDGVFFSIYDDRVGNELHFVITLPDGTSSAFGVDAHGADYTMAAAMANWSGSTPDSPASPRPTSGWDSSSRAGSPR